MAAKRKSPKNKPETKLLEQPTVHEKEPEVVPVDRDETVTHVPAGAENKDEAINEMPDVPKAFTKVLLDLGVKPGWAEAVTKFVLVAGKGNVFENPVELLRCLNEWKHQIPAYTRRQIMIWWMSQNDLPEPEDWEKMMNKSEKTDTETGNDENEPKVIISGDQIMASDKPMSITQAKKTINEIESMKRGGKGEGTDENKLTFDENGNIVVAPGAKLTMQEAAMYTLIQKSKQSGDTRSDFDIFQSELQKHNALNELTGVAKGGGGANPFSTPEGMETMKRVLGSDEVTKLRFDQMQENFNKSQQNILDLIKTITDKPKEDPQVAAMKTQLDELNRRLEAEREERHKMETQALETRIKALSDRIEASESHKQATDAYGIMGKAIDAIGAAGKDFKEGALQVMTRGNIPPANPVPTVQKNTLTRALGAEAQKATAAAKIGADLFAKPPPAQPPPQPPPFTGPPTIGLDGS